MPKRIDELAKGTWLVSTAYTLGDIVDYLGSSYICIVNNTGDSPTTSSWALLAQKGTEIELQKTATYIQWRLVGGTWANLVALIDLTGPTGPQGSQGIQGIQGTAGKEVQFQVSSGYIQWKYDSDVSWTNLIAISALIGPQGIQGVPGIQWLGNWSSATAYVLRDVVYRLGSSYICTQSHTNQEPPNSSYWNLVAQKGTDGTGSGDVMGPASSISNNIPTFDGTTGKIIKDSGVSIDTIDKKATQFPGICATTPISAADISIDYTTRVLTITPPLGSFNYFTDGNGVVTKHIVTGAISFPAFTDTSGIWNFYFDNAGVATVSQGNPPNYDGISMVYRLLWNATLSGSAKAVVEALETHTNSTSGIDHTWKHKFGTIWLTGGECSSNVLPSGTPNADGRNAVVALSSLINLDDNLLYTIANSVGGLVWQQDLGNTTPASLNATNSALFKVRLQDAGGLCSYIPATRFPFAFNGSNTPEFIDSVGTRTNVTAGNYFVYYLYSIQDPRNGEAIKSVSAPLQFNTLTLAQASSWSDLQSIYTTLNDGEIRPLYRLIFQYQSGYDVGTKKTALREVQDIRVARVTATSAGGSINATSVVNTPAGGISATNVQDALNELDTEKLSKSLYDANSVLIATTDDTPIALTLAASTILGRKSSGGIVALTAAELRTILNVADGATANTKATGAELNTGTDDVKFATAKALADSDYAKTSDITVTPTSSTALTNKDLTDSTNSFPSFIENKAVSIQIVAGADSVATGDGQAYITIPLECNGMNLVGVHARVVTAGTTNTTDVQIRNVTDSVDMLSTKLTIDSTETGSDTAATPAVIDTTKDDVATNDLIAIDVDAISTTAPKGLIVTLRFALP